MLFRSNKNSFWRSPLISKFQTNFSFFFFFRKRESNRTRYLIEDRKSRRSTRLEGGKWIGEKPCKKLRKMVAAHGRPWISFYRPLPVPSTLQRSNVHFRASNSKICGRLKAAFSIQEKKKLSSMNFTFAISSNTATIIGKKRNLGY